MADVLSEQDFHDLLKFSITTAKEAGSLILQGSHAIRSKMASVVDSKLNAVDLVTEWDVKVEDFIKAQVSQHYPHFDFMGEESYSKGSKSPLSDRPTFCVDPIDGTTNFVHGFPYACVSIGVIYRRQPVVGVIFNPFLNQLYSALKGNGAWLNEESRLPLYAPLPLPSLAKALVIVGWGSGRSESELRKRSDSFVRLIGDPSAGVVGGRMAHGLRSMGSTALNCCQVASGCLDVYWEIGCWPWDVCAGLLIAQEAGCMVAGSSLSAHNGIIDDALIQGRKYIIVRSVGDTKDEQGFVAQGRIIREVYETVEDWDP